MIRIFSEQDRQKAFEYILSAAQSCDKIISLVQVGSGAIGYHDARSDLDFVVAMDSNDSMLSVMDYIHRKIAEKYEIFYFKQVEASHLQVYLLSDLLEIDIGYGGYENAAARKPAFKVLYDKSGIVEEKMIQSRKWMDDALFTDKQKNDLALACDTVWTHLMHAAVAIRRGNCFRAVGELEYVRKIYIDLLGDRYRLESAMNREIDRLPEQEKASIRSTFVTGESSGELWSGLLNLTRLIYQELAGNKVPITSEMLMDYYQDLYPGVFLK